ncbi:hypothetical protein ABE67_12065 [Cytobacillus firmus]|nr:hypothetical protein [Cytobacillus firmus]
MAGIVIGVHPKKKVCTQKNAVPQKEISTLKATEEELHQKETPMLSPMVFSLSRCLTQLCTKGVKK